MRILSAVIVVVGALAASLPLRAADEYPSHPIRILVPWPPGGVADSSTRRLAARLTEELGQQVVVENKPGASGILGSEALARAAPDGYTLMRGDIVTMTIAPLAFARMPYDPLRDFAYVSLHGRGMLGIFVNPSLNVGSLRELVERARAGADGLPFASPGVATPQHLVMMLLAQSSGVNLVPVGYKGEGPAVVDVAGGQVPVMAAFPFTALPHVQSGRLKPLAVTGVLRSPALPGVPTVSEAGFPELRMDGWGVLVAPAKTPRAIIDKLNAAVLRAMKSPEVIELYRNLGADTFTSTPEEAAAWVRLEQSRLAPVVKRAGIRIE